MINSIISIMPILLLFVLGFFLKWKNIIKPQSIGDIKSIVANIALPALLFRGFMGVTLSPEYLLIIAVMFFIPVIMLLLGKVLNRVLNVKNRYFPYLLSGFEMGMFGYAIFSTVFGLENLPVIAIVDLGQVIFVFFILLPMLNSSTKQSNSFKSISMSFIKSPVIIAIILGLITGCSGIKWGSNILLNSILNFIDIVGALTMPLIMLSLGYELEFKKSGFIKAVKTVFVRKLILVFLAIIINKFIISGLLHLPELYVFAVLIMFLMPPPFVISIFMDQDDRESLGYITNTLSISILFSVLILIPFLP